MKSTLFIAFLATFSINAFGAGQGDATPFAKTASQLALNHALINVFGDILDHDSSVSIAPEGQDENGYNFIVTAKVAPQICSVGVRVSKETGMAFNEKGMSCK